MKVQAIIIFGPPGSGKGTQSKALCTFKDFYHLSSGEVFRNLDPTSSDAKIMKGFADKGELAPDELSTRIIKKQIESLIKSSAFHPERQRLLLDGIPRTINQAKILDVYLEVCGIIVINIEDSMALVKRVQNRGVLEGRRDDQDSSILQKRLNIYEKSTKELLDYYPKALQKKVNGEKKPLEVFREILNKLDI